MKASQFNYFVPTKDEDVFLLYNTLHGAVFVVDDEIKQLLESDKVDDIQDDILQEYKREKVVTADDLDEKEIIKVRQDKSKFGNPTTSVTLLTTYDCNLRCTYCYEGAGERLNDTMDEDTAKRVVEYIERQVMENRSKYLTILLYGGEPLLNYKTAKGMLSELQEWTHQNDIKFATAIVTNGTLLTQKHLRDLSTFNVKYIQITLDGPKEIHNQRRIRRDRSGTYDRIMESITMVQECKEVPNPLIRINIDSENTRTIPGLLDDLKEEGLNNSRIDLGILKNVTPACSSLTSCLSGSEMSRVLPWLWREALKRGFHFNLRPRQAYVFCGLMKDSNYTIDPNGVLFKCWDHVGIDEHRMGTIRDDAAVSLTPKYFEWMSRDALEISECRECILLPACGGGCAAISYAEKGTYKAPGCFRVKYIIEDQLKIYLETQYPERFSGERYVGEWDHSF